MSYTDIFSAVKMENFIMRKNCDILNINTKTVPTTYGKKNRYTPANPSFTVYKCGVYGEIYFTHMFS